MWGEVGNTVWACVFSRLRKVTVDVVLCDFVRVTAPLYLTWVTHPWARERCRRRLLLSMGVWERVRLAKKKKKSPPAHYALRSTGKNVLDSLLYLVVWRARFKQTGYPGHVACYLDVCVLVLLEPPFCIK